MISAEAPVLFAKAAEIFITELTLRAWLHAEDNKRRTLQVDWCVAIILYSSVAVKLTRSETMPYWQVDNTELGVKHNDNSVCQLVT